MVVFYWPLYHLTPSGIDTPSCDHPSPHAVRVRGMNFPPTLCQPSLERVVFLVAASSIIFVDGIAYIYYTASQ